MFESSPRPTKRQRTSANQPITPQTPRSSARLTRSSQRPGGRSVSTYGSTRKQNTALKSAFATVGDGNGEEDEQDKLARADFVDSAYHSMSTTQDELLSIAQEVDTPSKRGKRHTKPVIVAQDLGTTPSGKFQEKRTGRSQESEIQAAKAADQVSGNAQSEIEDSGPEEDTITVRTSGRARKKSWKSAEAESEDSRRAHNASRHAPSIALKKSIEKIVASSKTTAQRATSARSSPQPDEQVVEPISANTSTPQSSRKRGRPPKQIQAESPRADTEHVVEVNETPQPNRRRGRPPKTTVISKDSIMQVTPRKTQDVASISHAPPQPSDVEGSPTVLLSATQQQSLNQGSKTNSQSMKNLLKNPQSIEAFQSIKDEILGYLTNKRLRPLIGQDHEKAYNKVYQMLEQTVAAGEGNSMLVIGPRGTAKTTIVNTALSELGSKYGEDYHVIRLNGFIHTDDKLALKEIWRQLGKEMKIEDGSMSDRGNYADILASLLALLSQPEELAAPERQREMASRSVVFVLDEFDLFTTHPRQTLLYNLFDIAQSRKAPIAVLGLTTRIDIVECLEKRVKSRFSHRYVYVTFPRTLALFTDICKTLLVANSNPELTIISPSLDSITTKSGPTFKKLQTAWAAHIDSLLTTNPLNTYLQRIYYQTKSLPTLLNNFLIPIASMTPSSLPEAADFLANNLTPPDSKLTHLPSLSDSALSLLIAAARLDIVLDTDTVNFNMAFDEYTELVNRMRIQTSASGAAAVAGSARLWSREVALAAWERLEELELIIPVTGPGGGGAGAADVRGGGKLFRVDVALEEIRDSGLEMSAAMARWCREI